MSLGSKIFELRKTKNLSQNDLAELLDVSRQSISKWETDTAVPELDKLIKLCDVFDVSLDVLTERNNSTAPDSKKNITQDTTASRFSGQSIIGYILFGVSLIMAMLVIIKGVTFDEFIIFFSLIATLFVCGVVCLVSKRALYWCIWTIFAPICTISPYIVGLAVVGFGGFLSIALIIFMYIFANRYFENVHVKTSLAKGILLAVLWISIPVCVWLNVFVLEHRFGVSILFFDIIIYVALAFIETYTVCFLKNLKRKNKGRN